MQLARFYGAEVTAVVATRHLDLARSLGAEMPRSSRDLVEFLRARLQAGDFRAVIDRRYPLEEIVDAYHYVETRQKTGIVEIDIPPADHQPGAPELPPDARV